MLLYESNPISQIGIHSVTMVKRIYHLEWQRKVRFFVIAKQEIFTVFSFTIMKK